MRFVDIQAMDREKLALLLAETRAEQDALRFQIASGELKQMHKMHAVRREIARITAAIESKARAL